MVEGWVEVVSLGGLSSEGYRSMSWKGFDVERSDLYFVRGHEMRSRYQTTGQ